MRPIANLKRRIRVCRNGMMQTAKSTNAMLTPAFNVLSFEKVGTNEGYSVIDGLLTSFSVTKV